MIEIETQDPSREFLAMWQAAGRHIQSFFQDGLQSWLKVEPHPPFLEHLSFRIGNQVFFVRLEDVEDRAETPGNRDGLLSVAEGWKGFPCLMPMRRTPTGWKPELGGWGLIDLRNAQSVDPFSLVSDELIEVTDWELRDFAVQVVKQWLQGKGFEIMSTHSNPKVDPNIWFVGDNGPEWIIVRAARYPTKVARIPSNVEAIAKQCEALSHLGNFASVAFALAENVERPIWRGHAADVQFDGIVRV